MALDLVADREPVLAAAQELQEGLQVLEVVRVRPGDRKALEAREEALRGRERAFLPHR
jgi:hypothetical protein